MGPLLTTDLAAFKEKAKATWATGSYDDVSTHLLPSVAHLVRVAEVRPGERALDVACGTGITAITARNAGARVTGLDLTPELLSVAKEHAALAGFPDIEWRQGDAEELPFEDGTFDVVLSSYGHMFAPRPEVTMREMVRVAKPGGRIAFLTHPPEHLIGAIFRTTAKHVPPPPDAPPSPMQWGVPDVVRERLGAQVKDVHFERGRLPWPALSPQHFWRLFSTKYGPTMRAIATLGDRAKVDAMGRDFVAAVAPFWRDNAVWQDYLVTRCVKA